MCCKIKAYRQSPNEGCGRQFVFISVGIMGHVQTYVYNIITDDIR